MSEELNWNQVLFMLIYRSSALQLVMRTRGVTVHIFISKIFGKGLSVRYARVLNKSFNFFRKSDNKCCFGALWCGAIGRCINASRLFHNALSAVRLQSVCVRMWCRSSTDSLCFHTGCVAVRSWSVAVYHKHNIYPLFWFQIQTLLAYTESAFSALWSSFITVHLHNLS